jgi:hypothetical protein
MQVMQFALIAHRTGNRVRLRIASRRGDPVFFAELERNFLACPGISSARANPLAASIVITHNPAFVLSTASLASLGLACAIGPPTPGQRQAVGDAQNRALLKLALHLIVAGLSRCAGAQIIQIALEVCLHSVLHRLSAPQPSSAPSSSS